MLNCDGTGPATDVWIACSPSRGRARLKSPAILASKERLRRRKMARVRARVDALQAYSAWNSLYNAPPDIPEVNEQVVRVVQIPEYKGALAENGWNPIGTL